MRKHLCVDCSCQVCALVTWIGHMGCSWIQASTLRGLNNQLWNSNIDRLPTGHCRTICCEAALPHRVTPTPLHVRSSRTAVNLHTRSPLHSGRTPAGAFSQLELALPGRPLRVERVERAQRGSPSQRGKRKKIASSGNRTRAPTLAR